jgi:PAS domain-containing protein
MNPRILYLEDSAEAVDQVRLALEGDYLAADLAWVHGRQAFDHALKGGWAYDLLFLGHPLAGLAVGEVLAAARSQCPHLPVILLPATAEEDAWAGWLRQGAADCVPRAALARLVPVLRRTLGESQARAALREAQADSGRLVTLLRTVLESTSEGILVADLAGRITTYNRKFLSLCGIPEYVMAPMELDRVLRYLQDQFLDPEAFLREARKLGEGPERRPMGLVNLKNRRLAQVFGRVQSLGGETGARVFSFMEVPGPAEVPGQDPSTLSADLLEAVRTGRVVPWYLTEDDLVISEKGQQVLDLPPGGLPRDLPALEALIHPEDVERFRQALEHPHTAPFTLRLCRGDGGWILTRWNLKRGTGGYRGIFTEVQAPDPGRPRVDPGARFNYKVQV